LFIKNTGAKLQKHILIIIYLIITFSGIVLCCSPEIRAYDYIVRPKDTLSEITLMFTGTHDYNKIARQNRISNPDLIYPGDIIRLPPPRPIETLRNYLDAIYKSKEMKAYSLLSTITRSKISYDEFKKALDKITFYNLDSMRICSDFIENENHILQIKIFLAQDPASWGFNLIREKYKWYVLLFDLNPTNPQDDGFIEWRCNGPYEPYTNPTVIKNKPIHYAG
jgi:hypothetical protein